ncbi:MAG TPA: FAD-dependent oxidoreductase [Solirubrobacterales bacterium]|nr:FAD-dependent oxidoreductase [Solirubrobacterales bacterium]
MTEKRGSLSGEQFDVLVVGGGVIGLSCAWRLAQRGARVAVVERGEPGWGATRVAAGMLAPVGELTFGEPELLELTLAAARLYPGFVAELEEASGERAGYERLGALHVALDRDEAAQLRRVHDLQRSLELEAEWLPPRRCRDLEPGLTPSFHGGVFAAGEAAIDPRALTRALAAACAGEGVEIRRGREAVEGVFAAGRLVGVRTTPGSAGPSSPYVEQESAGPFDCAGSEELRADHVVLASGAWSGATQWLPQEARPPVRPVKGQVLELRRRDGEPPARHVLASERVYLVPRGDGRLIVGATVEEMGFDTKVTAGGVHELLREAYRLLPDLAEMELLGAVAGLRPGTPDNLPLVGPGAIPGLVLATGHFRNGILLAPLAAQAVADLLAGAPNSGRRSSFVGRTDNKGRTPRNVEVAR